MTGFGSLAKLARFVDASRDVFFREATYSEPVFSSLTGFRSSSLAPFHFLRQETRLLNLSFFQCQANQTRFPEKQIMQMI